MHPRIAPLLLLFSMFLTVAGAAAPETDPRRSDPMVVQLDALIDRIDAGAKKLRDATYTFYRAEYVDGKFRPEEKISIKHRFPHDIYMKWVGPVKNGREVLHRGGWNDGQIRVSLGKMTPTLNLDPRGDMAMDGERHAIFDLGPVRLTQLIVKDAKRIRANPALIVTAVDEGARTLYGESARCMSAMLPKDKDPALYARKMNLCVSDRLSLPIHVELQDIEDGAMRVIERYGYEGVKVNVGLTDADFSPEHPDYGF